MKRTNLIITLALSTSLLFMGCSGNNAKKKDAKEKAKKEVTIKDQELNIDLNESVIKWEGTLVGVYSHKGTLNFKSGSLKLKDGMVKTGSFVVDMSTMKATDDNFNPEEGKTKEKLIGHLSSDDFFNVENHSTAKFVVKEHKNGMIKGDLTIRGNTHEETVKNVEIKKDGENLVFKGELTFDRQKYDVAWSHPMKDKVLMDEIKLQIILK